MLGYQKPFPALKSFTFNEEDKCQNSKLIQPFHNKNQQIPLNVYESIERSLSEDYSDSDEDIFKMAKYNSNQTSGNISNFIRDNSLKSM